MTLLSNRKLLSALALALVGACAYLTFVVHVEAQPSSTTSQASATATTTTNYMTAGTATTTYQFDSPVFSSGKVANMGSIDSLALYVQFAASSSAGTLGWQNQYSNNGIDWYGENASQVTTGTASLSTSTSNVYEATSTVTHIWTPNVAGTSTKVVIVPVLPAFHQRVQFFLLPGSSAGAVYFEVDLKKNPSTP